MDRNTWGAILNQLFPDVDAQMKAVENIANGAESPPIGSLIQVDTSLTGTAEPDTTRYIRLVAGLTGAGLYNEGKFSSEVVVGTFPSNTATATISDPGGPMDGVVVELVETTRRFLQSGQVGTVGNDQTQGHIHASGSYGPRPADGAANVFVTVDNTYPGINTGNPQSDGINGTPRTGDHTRPRFYGVAVYMRFKA